MNEANNSSMPKANSDNASAALYQKILSHERLIDDLMMTIFFSNNCFHVQKMLRIILERNDIVVKSVTTQKELTNLRGRSIRLDILAKDSAGKLYNIEFQRASKGASPRRLRYHQSLSDASALKKGQSTEELPDFYLIMVLEKNHFKRFAKDNDIPLYHIHSTIAETGKPFDSGVHFIYVNGEYRKSNPIGLLIQDLFESVPKNFHDLSMARRFRRLKYGIYDGERIMNPKTLQAIHEVIQELYGDDIKKVAEEAEKRGEKRGQKLGVIKATLERNCSSVNALMDNLKCDANEACRLLKLSDEDKEAVLKQLAPAV